MRRAGVSLGALLGLLLLSSCAITPPVLGGPFPAGGDGSSTEGGTLTAGGLLTDDGVAGLLILNDPDSPTGAASVADYVAESAATTPETDPASCRDSAVPLVLLDRDASAEGTVFQPPTLFREAAGADLLVTQVARRFESAEDAAAFLDDLRAARGACATFTTADGSTVEQDVTDGDFPVRGAWFDVTTSAPDGSAVETFEWVLVAGNVAISLRADLLDEDAAATLRDLADEYAARLTE